MEKQPKFAVVTGASSGLGVDFAYQLALQGYSLFIAARRIEKLESVKKQIEATHNVKVVCVQCDLATSDGAQDLHQKVSDSGSPISVLINNAGLGTEGDFFEIDLEKNQQMTKVNIDAALELMWRFGNDMRKSGGGHILNVASFSAFQSPTSLATYAATKAFWLAHSQAMNAQRRESGVSVTATCPGFFKSEFFDKADVRANGLNSPADDG